MIMYAQVQTGMQQSNAGLLVWVGFCCLLSRAYANTAAAYRQV
jgi:hypothetical protein